MQDDWALTTDKVCGVEGISHPSIMPTPLTPLPSLRLQIIEYAAKFHGEQEVISRSVEGPTVVSTWRQIRDRAALCTLALRRLGVKYVLSQRELSVPPSYNHNHTSIIQKTLSLFLPPPHPPPPQAR